MSELPPFATTTLHLDLFLGACFAEVPTAHGWPSATHKHCLVLPLEGPPEICYVEVHKVATCAIKECLGDAYGVAKWQIGLWMSHGLGFKDLARRPTNVFTFSIVRNPFDRLVSCWEQKFNVQTEAGEMQRRHFQTFTGVDADTFAGFIRGLDKIPEIGRAHV
jgi:hypothetical protein